jgi:hypothetical protein
MNKAAAAWLPSREYDPLMTDHRPPIRLVCHLPETEVPRVAHPTGLQFKRYASYQVQAARLRGGRLRLATLHAKQVQQCDQPDRPRYVMPHAFSMQVPISRVVRGRAAAAGLSSGPSKHG